MKAKKTNVWQIISAVLTALANLLGNLRIGGSDKDSSSDPEDPAAE